MAGARPTRTVAAMIDQTAGDGRAAPVNVVIAGGGVAGLEALIALRDLAGDRVSLTLVAPDDDFVYRPLSVGEPFLAAHVQRYPLARIADHMGARLIRDAVVEVSPDTHEVVLRDGGRMEYGKLVLALGAKAERAYEHALTFGEDDTHAALPGLLADAEEGYVKRIAFVVPPRSSWTLPLYELAIMTARDVWGMGIENLEVLLVTPEERPLAVFGVHASEAVATLLEEAGVRFVGAAHADVGQGEITLRPGNRRLSVDRVVTLPRLTGPRLAGIPDFNDGYVATDDHARVPGVKDVYAAGDMTAFPVKQGGLAAQQADAAATTIAADAGAPVAATPFKPVLRGMLLLGRHEQRFLQYGVAGGAGEGEQGTHPLWWPPTKVAGRYVAPYLFDSDQLEAPAREQRDLTVEVPLVDMACGHRA
jgi:sulfide:quinone oxidoreductase